MNLAIEQEVRRRASDRCEYCHLPQSLSKLKFSIDHIIARQHAGTDALENLALSGGDCNRRKGPNIAGIDPQTKQLVRLFDPRRDDWNQHFAWNDFIILGITPIGRATVITLDINGIHQVAMRKKPMEDRAFRLP